MELWLHAQLLYLRIHFSHLRPLVQSSVSCGQSEVWAGSPADQALSLDSASSPVLLWGKFYKLSDRKFSGLYHGDSLPLHPPGEGEDGMKQHSTWDTVPNRLCCCFALSPWLSSFYQNKVFLLKWYGGQCRHSVEL